MKSKVPPPVPSDSKQKVVILGAGPAGLACAYELSRRGVPSIVADKNEHVGGLLRTLKFDGFLFDIGGHRFLSKNEEVNALWKEILGGDLVRVGRKSRILYRGNFFEYPLKPLNALRGLGIAETLRCLASYAWAKLFASPPKNTFESAMTHRFGKRLFEIFFKTYTEKVWGISCGELSSDWASQRIQNLSLPRAVLKALLPRQNGGIKTLSDEFQYPVTGPGLFCDRLREKTEPLGVDYRLEHEAVEVRHDSDRIREITFSFKGKLEKIEADRFFSSIPLPLLVQKLRPAAPLEVLNAAQKLTFRSFLVVYLIFDVPQVFPDNWLYIHSPGVKMGRIQNYKNWSPAMVPDQSKTSLGVEYFVNQGDDIWNLADESLIRLALDELEKVKFVLRDHFLKGWVVRIPNAYPVYNAGYRESLALLRGYLVHFENLQVVGRAGLFRYNNSDHALLTGLYAARNLLGENRDLWAVDVDGPDT